MAPSPPELGQPKAPPDKGDSKVTGVSDDKCKEMLSLAKSSTEDSDKKLAEMDDKNLKALLDEALTYKNPSDLEHKSDMFKELLKTTQIEDEAHNEVIRAIHPKRNSGRNTHSGSLQDLVVSDVEYGPKKHNSRQKKFSLVSSRQREGGSLPSNVNESASTPSADFLTMNSHFSRNKDEYMMTENKSIGANSSNHTVIDMGDADYDETKLLITHEPISNSINQGEEGTELKKFTKLSQQHYTTQVQISVNDSSSNNIDAVVKIPIEKAKLIDSGNMEPIYTCSKYNDMLDSRQPVTKMLSSIPSCSLSSREDNSTSMSLFNSSLTSPNPLVHSALNQANKMKAKNKQSKADRNTTVIKAEEVAGHQSLIIRDIDALISYIESTPDKNNKKNLMIKEEEKNKKNKNSTNNSNTTNATITKKDKNLNNRLKRCNSLEELSTSRNDDSVVTLRQKPSQKKSNTLHGSLSTTITTITTTMASTLTTTTTTTATTPTPSFSSNMDAVNNNNANNKMQTKRGERRSWGTEELNYLGDTTKIDENKSNKTIVKSNSNNNNMSNITMNNNNSVNNNINNNSVNNNKVEVNDSNLYIKKKDSLSIVSIESISTSNETAEFHVVTKKKKTKKKTQNIFNDDINIHSNNITNNRNNNYYSHSIPFNKRDHYNNFNNNNNHNNNRQGKFHSQNSNFTNDREVYMNHSFKQSSTENNNNSRRKSTSSVPPSEKSDTSDLDSVHSLPVESSSLKLSVRQQSTSSGGTPQASYADIAKIINNNSNNNNNNNNLNNNLNNNYVINTQYDKWPSVSSTKANATISTAVTSANASMNSSISQSSSSSTSTVRATTPVKTSSSNNSIPNSCNTMNCKGQNSTKTTKSSCTELLVDNNNVSYVNNNNIQNNNLNGKNNDSNNNSNSKHLTYSQSLIEDTRSLNKQQLPLTNPPPHQLSQIGIKSQSATFHPQQNHANVQPTINDAIIFNTKQPIQKSKSVDNNENFYNSIEQYPALEKTIKNCTKPANELKIKNCVNKAISNPAVPASCNIGTTIGAPLIKSEKKSKINTEITSQSSEILETINNSKNKLLCSECNHSTSSVDIVQKQNDDIPPNNLIEHSVNDLIVNNVLNTSKLLKRKKLSSNSLVSKTNTSNGNAVSSVNRPAVIILNDNEPKSHDFTFGFDIDKNLLFGDLSEFDVKVLEEPHDIIEDSHSTSDPNNSINTSNISNNNTDNNSNSTINNNLETLNHSDLGYLSISSSSANETTSVDKVLDNSKNNSASVETDPIKESEIQCEIIPANNENTPNNSPPAVDMSAKAHVSLKRDSSKKIDATPKSDASPKKISTPKINVNVSPKRDVSPKTEISNKIDVNTKLDHPKSCNSDTPPVMDLPPKSNVSSPVDVSSKVVAIQKTDIIMKDPAIVAVASAVDKTITNIINKNVSVESVTQEKEVLNLSNTQNGDTLKLGSLENSNNKASSVDKQKNESSDKPLKKIEKFVSPVIDKVHFVAPESLTTPINYDIVNFVGIAWEDVICGTNPKFYNDGQ